MLIYYTIATLVFQWIAFLISTCSLHQRAAPAPAQNRTWEKTLKASCDAASLFQSIEYIISLCKSKPCCVSVCFTNILLSFKCGMDSFTFFNSQNFKMTILYDGQIAQRLFFNIFTSLHNTQHTIVYLFFFEIHSILTYSYINKL